ncbi:sulfatase [Draconibacterium sp. IB214405]|uniref:sulfatase family protein n=1 Tax=Draconibacterium sp. IB214405 TaxID=3097352 RepID=UPI002A0AAFE8|nr:sulfatase [Draconibacterium sp. IB214405]MDX8340692.1 sulfatase [Draconibacterium sp. IB214405]
MKHLIFFVFIVFGGQLYAQQANVKQPNIIHILADDVAFDDLSCFGSKDISTPNLDALAEKGMKFTSFYAPHGTCTPSRAALLTGRYAPRVNGGEGLYVLFPHSTTGLEDEMEVTITELLKKQGYKTGLYGKWHLGHLPQYLPCVHGFDEFLGIPYPNDHGPERIGNSGWRPNGISDPAIPLIEQAQVIKRCDNNDLAELPALFTREACKFIYRSVKEDKKPFYLQYANIETHTPWFVPKGFEGRSKAAAYGDAVEYLDRSVGIIMNTLKRLNIEDNTIIVFSSDNGPLIYRDEELENCYGKFGFTDPERTHVLREGKYQQRYDGGIRVSCIMSWPGQIPQGTTCDEPITAMDLFTTFANITGAEIPTDRPIDGKDIQSLMRQEEGAVSPHEAIYGYRARGGLMSVRYQNWKLVFKQKYDPEGNNDVFLYDLNTDLGESIDVASENTDVVKKILKLSEKAELAIKEGKQLN